MPFAARRRHQHWTSDVRYIDHELGGRAYVVSAMDNHSRYILSSALTRSQDLSSYLAVLYAAVERYGRPTLGEGTTMHTGQQCLPAREEATDSRATCPSPTAAGHPTSTFG
jgi:transposase InsO family protein